MGFEKIAEASTGTKALELLEKVEFDVVITDLEMDEGDGPAFCCARSARA